MIDYWLLIIRKLIKLKQVSGYWLLIAHYSQAHQANASCSLLIAHFSFFNRQNNDDLILAVQAAGVNRGCHGFHKDKGWEKLAETEEDLLEHRTDGMDAFDTVYVGCEKFPQGEVSNVSVDVNGIV